MFRNSETWPLICQFNSFSVEVEYFRGIAIIWKYKTIVNN